MSSLKFSPRSTMLQPGASTTRRALSVALRSASTLLARLSRQLAGRTPRRPVDPLLEYHAEAGAPEGALYVDGRFVGFVDGVRRL